MPNLSNYAKKQAIQDSYTLDQNFTNSSQRLEPVDLIHEKYERINSWIFSHSLEHFKLTLKDLFKIAKISNPELSKNSVKLEHKFSFDFKEYTEFQLKINKLIQLYMTKIKHLLHGSRNMFGTVIGKNVAILIDSSEQNFCNGRRTILINHLLTLLNEQLLECEKLYFGSFGAEIKVLSKSMTRITANFINEVRSWLNDLIATRSCNLLGMMKEVLELGNVDTILLILGSIPDQDMKIICDYVYQVNVSNNINIHTVSYELCDQVTNDGLKTMAVESNSIFHCYNSLYEELIYTSSEIEKLFIEIKKCNEVLEKMQLMRQGRLGSALVEIKNQLNDSFMNLPPTLQKAYPTDHCLPLQLEMSNFKPISSAEWLSEFGLKAKHLDLYQVLAPNSYAYREKFISAIGKSVKSKVHSHTMTQFDWHDGTCRNVHVDIQSLNDYQRKLGQLVRILERRLDWLLSDSRMMFGAIVEESIILIIDLSISNRKNLIYLQSCFRKLLEQQLIIKKYFNIIVCCENIISFKPTVVKPTGKILQEAWHWILNLECGGSRDIIGALRKVFENEEEEQHFIEVEGVYIITSGMPDQPSDILQTYIEEKCAGRKTAINTILFQSNDCLLNESDFGRYGHVAKIKETLKNMCKSTNGRFHFYKENGSIESDDIIKLKSEIEKAINFSNKCSILINSASKENKIKTADIVKHEHCLTEETINYVKQPVVKKPTSFTQPKQNMLSSKEKEYSSFDNDEEQVKKEVKNKFDKTGHQFFYTDRKLEKGMVNKKFSPSKHSGFKFCQISVKDATEQCTSKQWMLKYSLSKLNLNLNKMTRVSHSLYLKHSTGVVDILNKTVEAKACDVLPSINIDGCIRHLLLSPYQITEMKKQLENALLCYLDRLQWLVSGSRLTFSTIVEDKILFLIDTSGSMANKLSALKSQLKLLLWEQLQKQNTRFNMIGFSNQLNRFRTCLVEATESNNRFCEEWIDSLVACRNTGTLLAMQEAFESECSSIYLITDGKPETSMTLLQEEVAKMNSMGFNINDNDKRNCKHLKVDSTKRNVKSASSNKNKSKDERRMVINTISLSNIDSEANTFLYTLAKQNGGRYHIQPEDEAKIYLFCHQLKENLKASFNECQMPIMDGDDLNRLGKEIEKARINLINCYSFENMKPHTNNDNSENDEENGFSLINETQLNSILMLN